MGKSVLSRHMIADKVDVAGLDALTEHLTLDRPYVISDYLNLLSAVWLRRLMVIMSVMVWVLLIWAIVRLSSHH